MVFPPAVLPDNTFVFTMSAPLIQKTIVGPIVFLLRIVRGISAPNPFLHKIIGSDSRDYMRGRVGIGD